MQAREQADQRRLPGSRHTDERDRLTGLDLHRDVIEDGPAAVVEHQIAQLDLAPDGRKGDPSPDPVIAGSVSSTSSIRFHDAMPRCSMFVTHPNAITGQLEHRQVGVERHELADA